MTQVSVLDVLKKATEDGYDILGELGHGGMATVFAARDRGLDRTVAIKVMAPELLATPGMVERFLREARTVAKLRHPNIVTIHQVVARAGLYFFIMEYVEGRTLADMLEEARTRGYTAVAESVVRVLSQAARALEYAHERGIIHRDVKPGNIIIGEDGHATLTDFGIAKVTKEAGGAATNTIIGTPLYMSPEQCLGGEVGASSDQYSLGVVGYEMLAGAPPFTGGHVTVMHAHTAVEPPRLELACPDCPPVLRNVVHRMLAKAPADRFASMGAVALALEGTLSTILPATREPVIEPLSSTTESTPASRRGIRGTGGVIGGVVALAAIAGVIIATTNRRPITLASTRVSRDSSATPRVFDSTSPAGAAASTAPTDSVRLAIDNLQGQLARANEESARGDYEGAATRYSVIASDAARLVERFPGAPADSLAASILDARRKNAERCAAYATMLRRRNRPAPAC